MVLFEEIAVGLCILLIYCAIVVFVVKSKFWRRVLLISCFTLILSGLASLITETKFFSIYVYPENLALKDFDITDYAVANMRGEPAFDDRIVLINFGQLSRKQTGDLISAISKFKPKVIGISAFYNCEGGLRDSINCPQLKDTLGNRVFAEAIRKAGNVVLASKLFETASFNPETSTIADSLETSDFIFTRYAVNGFINLPTNPESSDEIEICRKFFPKAMLKGVTELAFAAQIVKEYDPTKLDKLFEREREEEAINFRRNIDLENRASKYKVLDFGQWISSPNADIEEYRKFIEDKIVIIGYLGNTYGDEAPSQQFYTPLNPISAGRALPDMFGIVVYANIISMILDEDYINVLPEDGEVLFALLTCIFHVALLLYIGKKFPNWFELISIGLIIFQLFLYSWLRINLFIAFGLKSNLVATITTLAFATISINLCKELYHLSYKKLPVWLQQKI